ncbi:MAG: type IV secretion system protein [Alphaproteobacteria bacterium]|nr:type IV secretion system protein [Alphaproteobacteria bacterium]
MADQLGTNNTQQKLIAGQSIRPEVRHVVRNINHSEDSLVVNASEKRYLWTARAFAVVTAISLCCNLLLLLTVSNILPLYRVEPYLLTLSDKKEQVYNVIPYSKDMESQKAITETFVRQYILLRTTLLPDIDEMLSRWQEGGDLQEMSAPVVYQDFIKNTGTVLLQRMKRDGLTSNVKIVTVNEIEDGVWQVEYKIDYYLPSSSQPTSYRYRASLRVQYIHRRVKYGERLKNPVGFKVISYGTKKLEDK